MNVYLQNIGYNNRRDTQKLCLSYTKDTLKNILYNKNCPLLIQKIHKNHKINPWMTDSLLKCVSKINKLYKQYVRNNSQENKLLYTKYKNILTSV